MLLKNLIGKKTSERGVILYLAMIFLGIVLVIVLFIIFLFTKEFTMSANIKGSAKAIFAAETGVERALMEFNIANELFTIPTSFGGNLSNDARYDVTVVACCFPLKLISVGKFGQIKRAIEIVY